jgi:hypothetical protein
MLRVEKILVLSEIEVLVRHNFISSVTNLNVYLTIKYRLFNRIVKIRI